MMELMLMLSVVSTVLMARMIQLCYLNTPNATLSLRWMCPCSRVVNGLFTGHWLAVRFPIDGCCFFRNGIPRKALRLRSL
jgi:hypothetical protein